MTNLEEIKDTLIRMGTGNLKANGVDVYKVRDALLVAAEALEDMTEARDSQYVRIDAAEALERVKELLK